MGVFTELVFIFPALRLPLTEAEFAALKANYWNNYREAREEVELFRGPTNWPKCNWFLWYEWIENCTFHPSYGAQEFRKARQSTDSHVPQVATEKSRRYFIWFSVKLFARNKLSNSSEAQWMCLYCFANWRTYLPRHLGCSCPSDLSTSPFTDVGIVSPRLL